ncbi:hypothetical protein AX27061_2894 [Achromobacter xylosoxidans NBRC 15126 = ATCC 27061]|nr:hypothetical protein AX27061_2894 [Achromobacter xylosoxidans NBRC 15126 = ATCC 27061]
MGAQRTARQRRHGILPAGCRRARCAGARTHGWRASGDTARWPGRHPAWRGGTACFQARRPDK